MSNVYLIDDTPAPPKTPLIDFANKVVENIWPILHAQILRIFLDKHVSSPILEHTALVHPEPFDFDVRPCLRCGKLVGTVVEKKRNVWLGSDYCLGCELLLLRQARLEESVN